MVVDRNKGGEGDEEDGAVRVGELIEMMRENGRNQMRSLHTHKKEKKSLVK